MTNEEFQRIVLEELKKLNEKVDKLEQGQLNLEQGQLNLEQGQGEIRKDLKSVIDQTANLTEFKEEINAKIDKLAEELSTIEIVTSKNWNDIAKLKSVK